MTPALRMFIFLCMTGGVLIASHVYIYKRWIAQSQLGQRSRQVAKGLFVVLPLLMVASIVASRKLSGDVVTPLGYFGFGYMGVLFIGLTLTALVHGVQTLITLRLLRSGEGDDLDPSPEEPSRRLVLARGAALVSAFSTTAISVESLAQGRKKPKVRQVEVPIQDLPEALEGFRIVQLSDIHIGPTLRKDFLNDVVDRVNALAPDFVAITGDLVDGSVAQLGEHVRPLGRIKSRYGTFFTTGNHEYYSGADPWIAFLRSLDVNVLRNEHVTLRHHGVSLDVIGVDDWRADGFGGDHGHDLDKAVHGRNSKRVGILLAHQPKSIFEAAKHQIDLVLSGHTHGGQLWPFRFAVKLVQPYVEGLHQHNSRTRIFVHRGTGYWGIPMRLAVDAEVVELILKRPLQV